MGDRDDRAVVLHQGLLDCVLGGNVKVVGGLVEDEDVGLVEEHQAQSDPGPLSSGEGGDGPFDLLSEQQEPRQELPDLAPALLAGDLQELLLGCELHVQALVVLGVVADLGARRHPEVPPRRDQAQECLHEGGLALAVGPEDSDLVPLLDVQVDAGEDGPPVVLHA